jgi:hypothetical protein
MYIGLFIYLFIFLMNMYVGLLMHRVVWPWPFCLCTSSRSIKWLSVFGYFLTPPQAWLDRHDDRSVN